MTAVHAAMLASRFRPGLMASHITQVLSCAPAVMDAVSRIAAAPNPWNLITLANLWNQCNHWNL